MTAQSIPIRQLGRNGPKVPALGLGMLALAGAYGTRPSDEERFEILDNALALGETFWDTADIYGDSEEMIGRWFKRTGKRDEVFVATKFGNVMDGPQFKGMDSSGECCKKSCYKSLNNLGIDCIDLFYVHGLNPDTPIEETMRALVELQSEGKIKHIGLCGLSSNTLRRACRIAPVAAIQVEYSPFMLNIEREAGTHLLSTCRELGVSVVCYSPLGRGMLTSTFADNNVVIAGADIRSAWIPRFKKENLDANVGLAKQFKVFADKKGCTASQLALAWLLKQGNDIVPIPGTKSIKYLEDNVGATHIDLTDEEVAEVRKFVEGVQVAGERHAPEGSDYDYVDTKAEAQV
ncbi:putative Aldo/keto reductase [Seiridium unicorne]|uniref:Aldo/keto reductase n=1 Tax=Seiridium unicorne TaxID=138068 RepID=A0ABR2UMY5_9PEZI